jgi:hypothetical protein
LLNLLRGISSIPATKGGETGYGPQASQVVSLIDDIAKADGSWPVYGTADNLIEFLMDSYKLKEQAKTVFTEFDDSYDSDPDRPTASKSIRKAKESLMKCLKGVHTGRDYAVNVIFPLVRLLHFRYGTYGNISLVTNLTIRDLIAVEVAKKEGDKADRVGVDDEDEPEADDEVTITDDELREKKSLARIGSFPVFDLYGDNSKRAEALILAVKAVLFRKHKETQNQLNADRIGSFMESMVRLHQRMLGAVNYSENENDDLRRLGHGLFVPDSPSVDALIDEPLLAAFTMISEQTVDHPKRMIVALLKLMNYMEDPSEKRGDTYASRFMPSFKDELFTFVEIKEMKQVKTWEVDGVEHQRWQVTLASTERLTEIVREPLTVSTICDCSKDDAENNRSEWAMDASVFESVAMVRAWSKLLCTLLGVFWKQSCEVDAPVANDKTDVDEAMQHVEIGLRNRLNCARQMVHMLVLESGVDVIDEFDCAYEGLRIKRIIIAYYRSVLCYLAWYMNMRKMKFPWLSKMLYDLPSEARSMDTFFSMPKEGNIPELEKVYWGQFGILHFVRRVEYITFNCIASGMQRQEMCSLVRRLFELQRAFDVDLSEGRMWDQSEAVRSSLEERVELTDCFAINILHTMGPFSPVVDCIYLNRKLLTGTGLQSPVYAARRCGRRFWYFEDVVEISRLVGLEASIHIEMRFI